MAGAAAISALAALRAGAGLVTVACPEQIVDIVQVLCPCATCLPLEADVQSAWETLEPALRKADAIGAGCGLGTSGWARALTNRLADWLEQNNKPAVVDADALNLLSDGPQRKLGTNTVMTPHPMEASRLLHSTVQEVLADSFAAARKLSDGYGAAIVLKGSRSVLLARGQAAINPFGTPGMAKGGSGDALTGIAAALLAGRAAGAYAMTDLELLQTACALHGLAGEMAARKMGERGMLATDLCECIGLVQGESETDEKPLRLKKRIPQTVTVVVEHPAGSCDAEDRRKVYRRNCGYVQQVLEEYNEWQDAVLLGCPKAVEWFEGRVTASAEINGRTVWAVAENSGEYSVRQLEDELAFLGKAERIEMFI